MSRCTVDSHCRHLLVGTRKTRLTVNAVGRQSTPCQGVISALHTVQRSNTTRSTVMSNGAILALGGGIKPRNVAICAGRAGERGITDGAGRTIVTLGTFVAVDVPKAFARATLWTNITRRCRCGAGELIARALATKGRLKRTSGTVPSLRTDKPPSGIVGARVGTKVPCLTVGTCLQLGRTPCHDTIRTLKARRRHI